MTDDTKNVAEQQRQYWNSPVGDRWVRNQATLDGLFVPLTEALIEDAKIKPGEKILDVGCGAGTTTRMLASKVGAKGRVLGVDISTALMTAAKAQESAGSLEFFEGDAGSVIVPMEDADLIISRFGVMFFADTAQAFGHMRKVLKPDGRLCFVCWGPLQHNPWFQMPLDVIAARLGPIEPIKPRAPGPLAFAETDYIEEFLGQAKFSNIEIKTRDVQLICRHGPSEIAGFLMEFGPGARVLATLDVDEDTRRQMIVDLTGRVAAFEGENGVQIPANLHYVCAANS